MTGTPPNIIIIFSDQQRHDSMGCYGQELPVTPNLDRLAEEGTLCEYAFSPQPLCTPARAALQTGKYATEVDTWMLRMALPLDEKTLPTYFSESKHEYQTGYIGKWHLASTTIDFADESKRVGQKEEAVFHELPVPIERRGGWNRYWRASDVLEHTSHGFDGNMWDEKGTPLEMPRGQYRVDWVTDHALDFIHSREQDRPFLLFVSYIEPHWQNDRKTHDAPDRLVEMFKDYELPGDLVDSHEKVSWLKSGDFRDEYPKYLATCRAIDDNVGRILEVMKEQGLMDNTIIVYTSDHACHFGQRNQGAKCSCHDASIRIPLIFWGPGFNGGYEIKELTSLIDILPTLLDVTGVEKPSYMHGNSILSLINQENTEWPDAVYYELSPEIIGRGLRTRKWTYSIKDPVTPSRGRHQPASTLYVEDYLYDNEKDPFQLNNLI
ncbi:MAG: sulfatase-like hydrolase/transferase [Candidatus Hodarchaeota archaeon]